MVHFGLTIFNYGLLYAFIQYISMVYSTDTVAAHYIQYAYMLDVIVVCLSTLQIIYSTAEYSFRIRAYFEQMTFWYFACFFHRKYACYINGGVDI